MFPTKKLLNETTEHYSCKKCDYSTCKKSSWIKHLGTQKHNFNKVENVSNSKCLTCPDCNKEYKDRSGLWYHIKKCKQKNIINDELKNNEETTIQKPADLVTLLLNQNMELIKQNQEFKDLIAEQNKLMCEQNKNIVEIAGKMGGNTTNNTTNNTNNFNLQFFLNEQCKDALNIMDFINQLQVKLSDLDMVGRIGYTEGISKIFIRGLKELDVFKRPIHCSDLKRETLYVKDKDSWEKDNDNKNKMKTAIKFIAAKNLKQISDWKDEHPESDDYDSKKHMEYHNIIINATGGSTIEEDDKNFNKIIRNVAKEAVIDKEKI
jgi:hypothetical protein